MTGIDAVGSERDLTVSVGYATLAGFKISGNYVLALNLRFQHFCRPIHRPEIMAESRDG